MSSSTAHDFTSTFTYEPETDLEKKIFHQLDSCPNSLDYGNHTNVILLGKWIAKNASRGAKDEDTLRKSLLQFICLFNILDAQPIGLYAFQRIITDVVSLKGEIVPSILVALVDKLCSVDTLLNESAHNFSIPSSCLRFGEYSFSFLFQVRYRCRTLLQDSEENAFISENHYQFVMDILKHHPDSTNLLTGVTAISVAFSPESHTRRFFLHTGREASDAPHTNCSDSVNPFRVHHAIAENSRYSVNHIEALMCIRDTTDIIFEVIAETIHAIIVLFPRCSGDVTDLLAQKYPKLRAPVDTQLIYLKGCLLLAQRISTLRQSILKTVLSQLTAMDLEIKSSSKDYVDPDRFSEWKERQLHLLAAEVQRGYIASETIQRILSQKNWFETLYQKVKTDEDVDSMTFCLDILLVCLLKWTKQELQTAQALPIPSHLTAFLSVNSDEDDDDYDDESSATCGSDASHTTHCTVKVELTMADVMVADILGIFRSVVLATEQCHFVQYYFFCVTSFKVEWAEKLLQIFFTVLFDPDALLSLRRLCSAYIGSYVSRASFLPIKFVEISLRYLIRFLKDFLKFWDQRDIIADFQDTETSKILQRLNRGKAYINPQSRLTLFYAVFEALCYIISFHGEALCWGARCDDISRSSPKPYAGEYHDTVGFFNKDINDFLVSIMKCNLSPLIQCDSAIVISFLDTCQRLHLFPDLEILLRHVESVLPPIKNIDLDNHPFLPFNQYSLWQTAHFSSSLYRTWSDVVAARNGSDRTPPTDVTPKAPSNSPSFKVFPSSSVPHPSTTTEQSLVYAKDETQSVNDVVTTPSHSPSVSSSTTPTVSKTPHQMEFREKITCQDTGDTPGIISVVGQVSQDLQMPSTSSSPKHEFHTTPDTTPQPSIESPTLPPMPITTSFLHHPKGPDRSASSYQLSLSQNSPLTISNAHKQHIALQASQETTYAPTVVSWKSYLDALVHSLHSKFQLEEYSSSVTLPAPTFHALLSALVDVTRTSASRFHCNTNTDVTYPSSPPSFISECTPSIYPSNTPHCSCTDSGGRTPVASSGPLFFKSSENPESIHDEYEDKHREIKSFYVDRTDNVNSSQKSISRVTPTSYTPYISEPKVLHLSRTQVVELTAGKKWTRCRASKLSIVSNSTSIKQRSPSNRVPLKHSKREVPGFVTTPILDLSEERPTTFPLEQLKVSKHSCHPKAKKKKESRHTKHNFSFGTKGAPFREEQIFEELEPFLEWDASGFTSSTQDFSNKAILAKPKIECGSRMLELLSSSAYQSSLTDPSQFFPTQRSHSSKLHKKNKRKPEENAKLKPEKYASGMIPSDYQSEPYIGDCPEHLSSWNTKKSGNLKHCNTNDYQYKEYPSSTSLSTQRYVVSRSGENYVSRRKRKNNGKNNSSLPEYILVKPLKKKLKLKPKMD